MPGSRNPPGEDQPVVIADADEGNAPFVERQLRRAGVKQPIVIFRNGDDLLGFLADAAQKGMPLPCVLLLDPQMPGANGYDPVRWVRREKGGSEMLVGIFSATREPQEAECAAELGVQLFLKKNPDIDSLAGVIGFLEGKLPEATINPAAAPGAAGK